MHHPWYSRRTQARAIALGGDQPRRPEVRFQLRDQSQSPAGVDAFLALLLAAALVQLVVYLAAQVVGRPLPVLPPGLPHAPTSTSALLGGVSLTTFLALLRGRKLPLDVVLGTARQLLLLIGCAVLLLLAVQRHLPAPTAPAMPPAGVPGDSPISNQRPAFTGASEFFGEQLVPDVLAAP